MSRILVLGAIVHDTYSLSTIWNKNDMYPLGLHLHGFLVITDIDHRSFVILNYTADEDEPLQLESERKKDFIRALRKVGLTQGDIAVYSIAVSPEKKRNLRKLTDIAAASVF